MGEGVIESVEDIVGIYSFTILCPLPLGEGEPRAKRVVGEG